MWKWTKNIVLEDVVKVENRTRKWNEGREKLPNLKRIYKYN